MIWEIVHGEGQPLIALRPILRHSCVVADLDFFVDVVVGGAVLGVGWMDSPEDVARTLGGAL